MRSRPSTSTIGVISVMTLSRMFLMYGAVVDGEAIRQLHQRRRRAGFRRVDRAGDVVDRRRVSCAIRRRLVVVHVDRARVGELRERRLVLVDLRDQRFRRDRDGDHLAAFFRRADARRPSRAATDFVEQAHVLVHLLRVRQLAFRAGDVAEDGLRRRARVFDAGR